MKIKLTDLCYTNPNGIRLEEIVIDHNDAVFYWEDGYRTTAEILEMEYDDSILEFRMNCRYRDSGFCMVISTSTGFCKTSSNPVTYVV